MRVLSDASTIRSHVLVGGFVDNYMIWTYYGEKAPPLTKNPLNEIIQNAEFNRLFHAYDDLMMLAAMMKILVEAMVMVSMGFR
jgi:hypothetical protein